MTAALLTKAIVARKPTDDIEVVNPYTTANLQARIDAASLAGGGIVQLPIGVGAVRISALNAKNNVTLKSNYGSWFEASANSTSYNLIQYTGGSLSATANPLAAAAKGTDMIVLAAGTCASLGIVQYSLLYYKGANVGTTVANILRDYKFNVLKVKKVISGNGYDVIQLYKAVSHPVEVTDTIQRIINPLYDFHFEGDIRNGSNTGDTFGIHLQYFERCSVKNTYTEGFDSFTGNACAIWLNVGYSLHFSNNKDKGSGSSGSAAFNITQQANWEIWENTSTPYDEVTSLRQNILQAGGVQTATLDAGASAVNNAYVGTLIHNGTAAGGSAGTIALAITASLSDFAYNTDHCVLITAGTGAGQSRPVLSYNGATKVITVGVNWTTPPDNTSVYEVRLMPLLHIIAGTGAGQINTIYQYNGGTKVADMRIAWAIQPDNTSAYIIEVYNLFQDRQAEGFGLLLDNCHGGTMGKNGSEGGNGRQIKLQRCSDFTDESSWANNAPYNLLGYGFGACRDASFSGLRIRYSALGGLWSFGYNENLHFNNCVVSNNDRQYARTGYAGSADISTDVTDNYLYFDNCEYYSVFDGGTYGCQTTYWSGVNRGAVVTVGPSLATELTVYETVLPTSILENLGNGWEFECPFIFTNNTAGTRTPTWNAYLGIGGVFTSIFGGAVSHGAIAQSATPRSGKLRIVHRYNSTTNFRESLLESSISALTPATDTERITKTVNTVFIASTRNAPVTLRVTCTLGSSDANYKIDTLMKSLRLLR